MPKRNKLSPRSAHMAQHFAGRRGAGTHRGQGKWERLELQFDKETALECSPQDEIDFSESDGYDGSVLSVKKQ